MAKKSAQKAGGKTAANGDRVIAKNRRAHFDYELGERFEAGLVLMGSEARSLRDNSADLSEAWVDIHRGEAFVKQMRIPTLPHALMGHEETRPRKLLLHREQIERLSNSRDRERLTIVVTKIYFRNGRVKIEIALAKGKQKHDKRQTIKARDADREARAAMRRGRG